MWTTVHLVSNNGHIHADTNSQAACDQQYAGVYANTDRHWASNYAMSIDVKGG